MKISIYTFVQNGIRMDFHVVDMLKHHLDLADEIIVNEGFSRDGTYEAIKDLDPKIKVFRSHWDRSNPATWHIKFKNEARQRCSGDWCILLDCDEFIPEWEFPRLRSFLENTNMVLARVAFKHFYANYRIIQKLEGRVMPPKHGVRIHRNAREIVIFGDGSDVRHVDSGAACPVAEETFECHHFGEVRKPARLRHKWYIQARQHSTQPRWGRLPAFLFRLFPHNWFDEDILSHLAVYEGPFIKAVRDNPSEFVRDDFRLYDYLRKKENAARAT